MPDSPVIRDRLAALDVPVVLRLAMLDPPVCSRMALVTPAIGVGLPVLDVMPSLMLRPARLCVTDMGALRRMPVLLRCVAGAVRLMPLPAGVRDPLAAVMAASRSLGVRLAAARMMTAAPGSMMSAAAVTAAGLMMRFGGPVAALVTGCCDRGRGNRQRSGACDQEYPFHNKTPENPFAEPTKQRLRPFPHGARFVGTRQHPSALE